MIKQFTKRVVKWLIFVMMLFTSGISLSQSGNRDNGRLLFYGGTGLGFSAFKPRKPSQSPMVVTQTSFAGNIMINAGVIYGKHQVQISYYFEQFLPETQYFIEYPWLNGSTNLVPLIALNINENTFGLLYGFKIPFHIAKNKFNFYPKAGFHLSTIASIQWGNELNEVIIDFAGMVHPDKLYVVSRHLQYRKTNMFASGGFEIETMLTNRIHMFWQSLYNFSLGKFGTYKVLYYFGSLETGFYPFEETDLTLSNFNTILGIRYQF